MKNWLLLVVLVGFLAERAQTKVKLVIDLIRHGARAPAKNYSFFPDITWTIPEELTAVGERQHCLLGHLRRSQYVENSGLLPLIYDPTSVYVRSTDARRTLMSAQAYLLGLYPTGLTSLNKNQVSHAYDLLKPPIDLEVSNDTIAELKDSAMPFGLPIIPIQSVNSSSESLLLSGDCPLVDYLIVKYFDSEKHKDLIKNKFRGVWQEIMTAYPEITLEYLLIKRTAYLVADFIICAAKDGRIPSKLNEGTVKKLMKFVIESQKDAFSMSPIMNKIGMQKFTEDVLTFMNRVVAGSGKMKYVLYSAHDVTLVVVLLGLARMNSSISIDEGIDYASNLLFELNVPDEAGKEAFVKIYFNGDVIHDEIFSTFSKKFKELGELGMSREQACKVETRLRTGWTARGRTGIIEDLALDD